MSKEEKMNLGILLLIFFGTPILFFSVMIGGLCTIMTNLLTILPDKG
jgi:hypothetical protein